MPVQNKHYSNLNDVLLLVRRSTLKCLGENGRAPPGIKEIAMIIEALNISTNGDRFRINCTSSCYKAQLMPTQDASLPDPVTKR